MEESHVKSYPVYRLNEVVDRALSDGPLTITRHGHPTVVVVAAEQYARAPRREKLLAVLHDCPVKGRKLTRDKDTGRTQRFQ